MIRLLAVQRNGLAHFQTVVIAGKIVLDGDGNAAHNVVQQRHGVHVQGGIAIHRHVIQELGYRPHRVFAAVLHAGAHCVGHGDLHLRQFSGGLAVHVQQLHGTYGVTVDLQDGVFLAVPVHHHQQQRVGLSAAIVAVLLNVALMVDAHQQKGFDVFTGHIGVPLIGDGLQAGIPQHLLHRFSRRTIIIGPVKPAAQQPCDGIDARHRDDDGKQQHEDAFPSAHCRTVPSACVTVSGRSWLPQSSICSSAIAPSFFSMILRPAPRFGARDFRL